MKYLPQMLIILLLSALGELLNALIPLPIPASIYGMVLLAVGLFTGLIRLEWVKETGKLLVSLLSLLFVAPLASLLDCWDVVREHLGALLLLGAVSTVLCFGVTGLVTQALMGKGEDHA